MKLAASGNTPWGVTTDGYVAVTDPEQGHALAYPVGGGAPAPIVACPNKCALYTRGDAIFIEQFGPTTYTILAGLDVWTKATGLVHLADHPDHGTAYDPVTRTVLHTDEYVAGTGGVTSSGTFYRRALTAPAADKLGTYFGMPRAAWQGSYFIAQVRDSQSAPVHTLILTPTATIADVPGAIDRAGPYLTLQYQQGASWFARLVKVADGTVTDIAEPGTVPTWSTKPTSKGTFLQDSVASKGRVLFVAPGSAPVTIVEGLAGAPRLLAMTDDEKHLLLASGSDFTFVDVEAKTSTKASSLGASPSLPLTTYWSGDGAEVFFVGETATGSTLGLFHVGVDGSAPGTKVVDNVSKVLPLPGHHQAIVFSASASANAPGLLQLFEVGPWQPKTIEAAAIRPVADDTNVMLAYETTSGLYSLEMK